MLTKESVKEYAKSLGADVVGITPLDRFEGAPPQMDPRFVMPEAKSMIVMGFRVMRGSLRGIEEGTMFNNYSAMGYAGMTFVYIPMTVWNLCKAIEDEGYEAIPLGHQGTWPAVDRWGELRENFSRPVEPGKPHPDVEVHLRIAAYLAGLGEIGFSKVFLSPRFGPRIRFGIVLTELELEPDPIYSGPKLCNKCMACVKDCPTKAMSATEIVKVNLAGHEVEWGKLNEFTCAQGLSGAVLCEEGEEYYYKPYHPTIRVKPGPHTPFPKHPGPIYRYGSAVCGGKGCVRACMISLEKRGVLENKFKTEFRRKKPWSVDWSDLDLTSGKERNTNINIANSTTNLMGDSEF